MSRLSLIDWSKAVIRLGGAESADLRKQVGPGRVGGKTLRIGPMPYLSVENRNILSVLSRKLRKRYVRVRIP